MGLRERIKNYFTGSDDSITKTDSLVRSASTEAEWHDLQEFLGIDNPIKNSMQEATYYTCMRILRETVGKMPLRLMCVDSDNGIREAKEHPLYDVLTIRPNKYTTATAFWASMEQDRQHFGNAYAMITGAGTKTKPYSLWRMPPSEVEVWYDDAKCLNEIPDVYYMWSSGGDVNVLKSTEVLHFRTSDTLDGIMGIPLIDRLNLLLEGSLNAQGFQNEFIGSGMSGKSVLQYTGSLEGDGVEAFTRNIENYIKGNLKSEGIENVIPIPVGATLTPLNLKLTDAQFIELKKYSSEQIAAAFGVFPQQIGNQSKQSYASAQAQQEMYYTETMLYILRHYENECDYKLLSKREIDRGYFSEFDSTVMLRTDYKTQVEANQKGIESGQITPNEARGKLRLPSKDEGDVLLGNGALIPISMAGTQYTPDNSGGGETNGDGSSNQEQQ